MATRQLKETTENEREEENAFPVIPIDLTMEIFSRLPAKPIARCHCLSKPWATTLRRSDFTELFLTRSSARPQLLFKCRTDDDHLFFFSSPQPQNPDENSSPLVVSNPMKISFDYKSDICRPVNGLVCVTTNTMIEYPKKDMVSEIYNPSTRQSLVLPNVKPTELFRSGFTMLGYDPIDKQFKLLSITYATRSNVPAEYQILTLGTGINHSWRKIECCRPHDSYSSSSNEATCIHGVLYYIASEKSHLGNSMVVCFDVRSEKFRFIQVPETLITNWRGIPVKYNGKLGFLVSRHVYSTESIELCVFEEDGQQWSKLTFVLPDSWQDIVVGMNDLDIVGMTPTNEIVLVTYGPPFYVYYYNMEKKSTIKLQIQGLEAFEKDKVQVYLNHIENLRLM